MPCWMAVGCVEDIALFTQKDACGDAGFAGSLEALKRHGLEDEHQVLHVRYERNTLAVEDALASLLYAAHPPRAVVMVGNLCAQRQVHHPRARKPASGRSFTMSFLSAASHWLPPGPVFRQGHHHSGCPAPGQNTELNLVREFREDLYTLDATFDRDSAPGRLRSGTHFDQGARKYFGPPTREKVVDALEGLGHFDLGIKTVEPQSHGSSSLPSRLADSGAGWAMRSPPRTNIAELVTKVAPASP